MNIKWLESDMTDYAAAMLKMASYVQEIRDSQRLPSIWMLQHNPVYTYGPSFQEMDSLHHLRAPAIKSTRGGLLSYHGPEQLIVYPMLFLDSFEGVRMYIRYLEKWMVRICQAYGVKAFSLDGQPGIFTDSGKIGSIGIAIKNKVTYHGFSINVFKDKKGMFKDINPCGLDMPVTSLEEEKNTTQSLQAIRTIVRASFEQ